MNASAVQSLLGRIYDTPIRCRIEDHLLTERAQLPAAALNAEEQLLVAGEGDTVYVSLFVDATVLDALNPGAGPWQLGAHNLAAWLTLVEGVSHFQYLTYHASHDRPVSQLELELQAEVDKYVSCIAVLARQDPTRYPVEVLPQLFSSKFRLDPALQPQEAQRYVSASRGAARYCGSFERSLRRAGSWESGLGALRRFYRWPLSRKLALIDGKSPPL